MDATTTDTDDPGRYAFVQRVLHWLIAVIVLGSLAGGAMIAVYGYQGLVDTFGQATVDTLYKYHKTFGVLILGLMLVRLAVRLAFGRPDLPASVSPGVARAADLTQRGFYVLLILMPVLGWMATATGGYPIEFFDWTLPAIFEKDPPLSEVLYRAHGMVGLAIFLLLCAHVAGALRHWLVKRDGVMSRMTLP